MNLTKDLQPFFDRGFAVQGRAVYGAEDGVPFLMTIAPRACSAQFSLDGVPDGQERKAVKRAMQEAGWKVMVAANAMTASIKVDRERPAESVLESLSAIVAAGRRSGVPFSAICPFCGGSYTDACMLSPARNGFPAGYRTVHRQCVASAQAELQEKAARKEGSYLTGVIGALLGMAVGILPTVFTIWRMNTVYALVCALIPISAFYGYKLFKGRMNGFAVGITIVLSLLGTLLIEAALDILDSMVHYGASFAEAVEYMVTYLPIDAQYRQQFFSGLWQLLLFAALGVLVCSGVFKRTDTGQVKAFANMVGTLRPNPPDADSR